MPLDAPLLFRRIPTHPWGDPADRKFVDYDAYVATDGYAALDKAIGMEPSAIVDVVKAAELRGRGGAGFPAGMKWSFLPPLDGEPRYLCINADESEPATFKDQLLIQYDPHSVIEGIALCMLACQLDTAYFYIRGEYHHHRDAFDRAIQEAYDHDILGPGLPHGPDQRPRAAPVPAPRRGGLHLRRRDRPHRIPRRQTRLAPHQASLPRRRRRLRPPHDHQQRRDPRQRPARHPPRCRHLEVPRQEPTRRCPRPMCPRPSARS